MNSPALLFTDRAGAKKMPHPRSSTTIAILGGNPVVANALALLLDVSGYDTKILKESPTALAGGVLDDVDLLLLAPGLSNGSREALLSAVRVNPKTAYMPVFTLSAAMGEVLDDESHVLVAWPSRIEELVRQIEAVLAPATSAEG